MAKKKITGVGGNVSLPTGFNGHFAQFSHDFQIPEVETTGFADGGFWTGEPAGPIRVTGDVSGVAEYDDTSAQPIPDSLADGSAMAVGDLLSGAQGAFTLTWITGCTLGFDGNITSWSGTRGHAGRADSTWRYGSSGVITITWDETA